MVRIAKAPSELKNPSCGVSSDGPYRETGMVVERPHPCGGLFVFKLMYMEEIKNIAKKLLAGDFGLVKTYWLFGFCTVLFLFGISTLLPGRLLAVGGVITLLYVAFIFIGIWNASNKYSGPRIWAWLAKAAVISGIFQIIFICYGAFSFFSDNKAQQVESVEKIESVDVLNNKGRQIEVETSDLEQLSPNKESEAAKYEYLQKQADALEKCLAEADEWVNGAVLAGQGRADIDAHEYLAAADEGYQEMKNDCFRQYR